MDWHRSCEVGPEHEINEPILPQRRRGSAHRLTVSECKHQWVGHLQCSTSESLIVSADCFSDLLPTIKSSMVSTTQKSLRMRNKCESKMIGHGKGLQGSRLKVNFLLLRGSTYRNRSTNSLKDRIVCSIPLTLPYLHLWTKRIETWLSYLFAKYIICRYSI